MGLTCCSLLPFSSSLRTSCSFPFRSSLRSLYSFSVLSISLSRSDASFLIFPASSWTDGRDKSRSPGARPAGGSDGDLQTVVSPPGLWCRPVEGWSGWRRS